MAGYSDAPMRQLAAEAGALWTVSEMISARGLIEHDGPDLTLGRPYPGEQHRVVQLFGGDPHFLSEAVRRVEEWFAPAAIDFNMGCPVPKVKGKGGACLLQTPESAHGLISALKSSTSLDVSAKIRLGWDKNRAVEIAQGLEAAGANLITVHGRTAEQRYSGEADWEAIAEVAAAVNIPVVGSGDITDVRTATERQKMGVAAVMIGRGAVGNVWIFSALAGKSGEFPSARERARLALRHAQLHVDFYGPDREGVLSIKRLRKVFPKYLPDHPELRAELVQVTTVDELENVLRKILDI